MITNRGMLKWQPFSSVVPSSIMINDVLKEKNRIKMPVLSDDQKQDLQVNVIEAYNNQDIIKVKYYKGGRFYLKQGRITNIDENKHKITINNDLEVFFSQIIEIS